MSCSDISSKKSFTQAHQKASGINLCASLWNPAPSDDDLLFLRQLGVGYVSLTIPGKFGSTESLVQIKRRYAQGGIALLDVRNIRTLNMEEVVLNLPGRDEKIEYYKTWLHNLGKAGIHYTTYLHSANGIWTSEPAQSREADTRDFNLASPNKQGVWFDSAKEDSLTTSGDFLATLPRKTFRGPLTHGRVYTPEEMWENYTYFIRRVTPIAEECGVRIGVHPDDPPVPVLGGVPRLFSNFDGYKRAMEIANSPNVGLVLCCGCVLEGGKPQWGMDPEEMVRHFGPQKKIFEVEARNVSAPLPHYTETFIDNGYYDMYKVMKALQDITYDGIVIPDHFPKLIGGWYAQTAYAMGYLRALLNRAVAESGG
jgi:mannonate dehydratase